MTLIEAIAVLADRAERWAEFHEPEEDLCDGYKPPNDTDEHYGHATCEELDQLNDAMDVVNEYTRKETA